MNGATTNKRPEWRDRSRWIVIAVVVVFVGLACKWGSSQVFLSPIARTALGWGADGLWAVMFYSYGRVVFPYVRPTIIAAITLGFTFAIEVSQLSQASLLERARDVPVLRFLLGSTFLWSDLLCLTIGTAVIWSLDRWTSRRRPSESQ